MFPDDFTPYQLTPEQIQEGWTREERNYFSRSSGVIYRNPSGTPSNPDPKVPAGQWWYKNRQMRNVQWIINGKRHDPDPNTSAYKLWHSNGNKSCELHFCDGKLTSQKWWYEDGTMWEIRPSHGPVRRWLPDGRQVELLSIEE